MAGGLETEREKRVDVRERELVEPTGVHQIDQSCREARTVLRRGFNADNERAK